MLAALDVARTTALAIDDRMKGTLCALVGLTCVAWSIHSSYCPINASRCYAIDDESRERSKGWEIVGKKCVRDASEIKTCVHEMRDVRCVICFIYYKDLHYSTLTHVIV